jgi:hypothetical protein
MCPRSLEVLSRSVLVKLHPDQTEEQIEELIGKISASFRSAAASRP